MRGADAIAATSARQHESFDFDWRFQRGDAPGAEQPAFADSAWRALDLPHDWSIEGPYDQNAPTGGTSIGIPTGSSSALVIDEPTLTVNAGPANPTIVTREKSPGGFTEMIGHLRLSASNSALATLLLRLAGPPRL